jgi:DNA polymerase-3 subunit epsilon
MYSIIDIETTGGRSRDNKITEIAIINHDGKKVVEKYSTLINPEQSIPYFIEKLTGINNEMVADAPKFYEVAKKIIEMTEGNIFVAHNVHFDYSFIQKEFSELGYQFKRDKLCTVRLARKFLPGHASYSLGKICADLDIPINGRHRAMGDATATTTLFEMILEKDITGVDNAVKEMNQHLTLPPYLDPADYEKLPHKAGVYYLWDKSEQLLYIGKSKDIKKTCCSAF